MLNEASALQLGELKKALKKDSKVNVVLSKSSTFDSIEDKKAFVSSIKYWIFNNENVRDFARARAETASFSRWDFDRLKKIKPDELDGKSFESMKDFVSDLFRDVTAVSNLTVSSGAKKEINEFINGNRGYHNLSSHTQKELSSIPGLKPNKPIVLYRGLLFGEWSLQNRTSYGGTLVKGEGIKFLESVRKGSKIVDLNWGRASSWSTSKEIATRFAKYGPAPSSFAATMQMLSRESKNKEIDGAMGFVISTRMQPEDVLLDVSRLYGKLKMAHGDEDEVIVKPGTYTCKIVHKYTPTGEVDVVANDEGKSESLQKIIYQLSSIEKIIPDEFEGIVGDRASYSHVAILRDASLAKKLATNGATTAGLHAYDKTMPLLKDVLMDFDQLDITHFAHSDNAVKSFNILKDLNSTISSTQTIVVNGDKKKISPMNMSGERYRNAGSWPDLGAFEREYMVGGRLKSQDSASLITGIARIVGVDTPTPAQLKQYGNVKQDAIILEVMNRFFSYIDISAPEEKVDQTKMFVNVLRKIHRNKSMFEFLSQIDRKLKALKQPVDINISELR